VKAKVRRKLGKRARAARTKVARLTAAAGRKAGALVRTIAKSIARGKIPDGAALGG
jgi:hypothetical protein